MEPEIDVYNEDNLAMTMFAAAQFGVGIKDVELESTASALDQSFNTVETHVGFRGGMRLDVGKLRFETGYVWRRQNFDESDPEIVGSQLVFVREVDLTFEGFFLSMGVRW